MITHMANGRCSNVVVSLDECPWLKGTDAQLPGFVYRDYVIDMHKGKRRATIGTDATIYCFESTGGNYVIELHYPNADDLTKERFHTALDKFVKDLYMSKVCTVDPTTGYPPSKIKEPDYSDFI